MPHTSERQDPLASPGLLKGSPEQAVVQLGHGELPLLADEDASLLVLLPSKAVRSLTELVARIHIVLGALEVGDISSQCPDQHNSIGVVEKENDNEPCDSSGLPLQH